MVCTLEIRGRQAGDGPEDQTQVTRLSSKLLSPAEPLSLPIDNENIHVDYLYMNVCMLI